MVNNLLKKLLPIVFVSISLFADVAPTSSGSSSGIVDFYFTSSTTGSEVPKVYIDVAKIQKEVNSVIGYFPRTKQIFSCFGSNADVCQKDAAQCNAVSEAPTCPTGGSLNTVRDMCQAEPIISCGAGYTFDSSIDRCVKNVDCPEGGIFNAVTDRCEKVATPNCPAGYILDTINSVCYKIVDCGTGGTFNPTKDRCEKPLNVGCSDASYSYNPTTYRCERSPVCSFGTYNATYDKCLIDYTAKCDSANGYMLNLTTNRCEKSPPICPTGSSYNATTNRCEDATSFTSKTGSSYTYAATTITAFGWDNCEGGNREFSSATTYCNSKGKRLPFIDETKPRGGLVPSCPNGQQNYTMTQSINSLGGYYYWHDLYGVDGNSEPGLTGGETRCVGNTTTYICSNGGTLSGSTCTVNTLACPTGYTATSGAQTTYGQCLKTTCSTGLTHDATTGMCVANPTCPITAGYGAASFDGTTDVCWAPTYKDCTAYSGFIYDSASGKCAGSSTCPSSGLLDTASDKCYQSACPSGYTFNSTTKACEATPTCTNGTYNTTYDKCLIAFTPGCDSVNAYAYNSTRTQCERTPQCQTGSSYNATTNRCEGISACVSPAVWDSTTQKCKIDSTYAATATSVLQQSGCAGSLMNWSTADTYCKNIGSGWRLPDISETTAGGGSLASCSGQTWTSTVYSNSHKRWQGTTQYYVAFYDGYTQGVRCVGNTTTYSCNTGDTLSGTTCTTTTSVAGTCAVGLTPDSTTGKCVANPTCPVSTGWSATFDGTVDVCKTTYSKDCPIGMIYDTASNMCAKSADCVSPAILNTSTDKCTLTIGDCDTWSYDNSTNVCYSSTTCGVGAYTSLRSRCEISTTQDCGTYTYDNAALKCFNAISCPTDATFAENSTIAYSSTLDKCVSNAVHNCAVGYTYNGLPIVKCEAVPICVHGVYQISTHSCANASFSCPIGNYTCHIINGIDAWCSPYECTSGQCGIALCPTQEEATIGVSDPSVCSNIVCDITKPYNEYCGKVQCPTGFGVYSLNGKCYQDVCPVGSIQQADGSCQQLQCPAGTTEVGGICIVN